MKATPDSDVRTPVCLIVLDGWGEASPGPANAISLADTPNLDRFFQIYPHTTLRASGEAVGLPAGQMGNSEVGHLNLGAGRVVYQDLTRINQAIEDGSFYSNPPMLAAVNHARDRESSLHLIGLLSDGGVHSDIGHLKALLRMAKQQEMTKVYLHLFLDGRDVSPTSGIEYLREIIDFIKEIGIGEIATVCGRYYGMDRDRRWERTKQAYDAIVHGVGLKAPNPVAAVSQSYAAKITDEFVLPTVTAEKIDSRIHQSDSVVFFNFRPDRARQLTSALIHADFQDFDRGESAPLPYFVSMTEYDATFPSPIGFPPELLTNVLAVVLSNAGKKQLHIAETEKYAHVTFFFNGGVEKPNPGEVRKLIPSPQDVPTYDKKPQMSAREVTAELLDLLRNEEFDFVIVNYANCDMVGHTGDLQATIKAVEVVDECLGRLEAAVTEMGGTALITSDHGNAENMIDEAGGPNTAHTNDEVPLIITIPGANLRNGSALCDVAPTVLALLHIPKPAEMTGTSIISGSER